MAARASNRRRCVSTTKVAEGGFNKVFLLTMDDGHEIIARIPTPIAGPSHYTTASEVATMNFLRDVLEVPVPQVLAYSTDETNPVGAEYIIMERLKGESLASRWLSLSTAELKDVLKQVVEVERKIFSHRFPAYGSLYHKDDLAEASRIDLPTSGYCLGPTAKRQFWYDERAQLSSDRGPCKCFWRLSLLSLLTPYGGLLF